MVVLASMWTVPQAPPVTQQWYQSPGSTKGTTKAAGPFAQKAATAVQTMSVRLRRKPATAIQASKSFRLKGEHDKVMDSHLRGSVVVYKCVICLTSDKRVKVEHLTSKRTHKLTALRFWVRV